MKDLRARSAGVKLLGVWQTDEVTYGKLTVILCARFASIYPNSPHALVGSASAGESAKSLVIDGQKIDGNVIPLPTDGRTAVKVEVTLGA